MDDEIDLFELLETLWDGRWLIGGFVALAMVMATSFLFVKEPEYSSKLAYSSNTLPPFYENDKALSECKKKFYDKATFDLWSRNNSESIIRYEEFSDTEIVEGFVLSKDEDDRLALLSSDKKRKGGGSFVRVKSNQLPKLNDFYLYAQYINTLLSEEYIQRSKDELVLIENRLEKSPSVADSMINNLLAIDRYIDSASKGARVLSIARPTIPEKTSPKSALILVMSVMLGGMAGVFYILIRNAVRKRKALLASA